MTETREEDINPAPVRLREMSSVKQKDPTGRDRSPGGPIKSPFSNRLSSNRDSGIGIDSPASVTSGGHFPFELEDSGHVDSEDVFGESAESDLGNAPPVGFSTPVTQPIPIPRRQNEARNTTARRPLAHRYSTGMFGNFPGEGSIQHRGTQTPSQSSQVISEAVHWQLGSSDEHDFSSFSFEQPGYPTAIGTAVARLRECTLQSSSYESNLPDLVPVRPRPRAQSECYDRREFERSVGQELQRLGDDFHTSYQDLSPIRNASIREEEFPDIQPSSYPGAAAADRGFWVKLKSALSPSKDKLLNVEKDPNADKAKKP